MSQNPGYQEIDFSGTLVDVPSSKCLKIYFLLKFIDLLHFADQVGVVTFWLCAKLTFADF